MLFGIKWQELKLDSSEAAKFHLVVKRESETWSAKQHIHI